MTAKISPRHRQAFLEALAETGNYTLAASQVRVSKDWAFRLRRRDAGFDAACREARERARVRLAKSDLSTWVGTNGSPPHPPPLRGSSLSREGRGAGSGELVIERGNGRVVQLKRSAGKRWTWETERRFLALLAGSCNVRLAAAEMGVCVHTAYKRRRSDPGFARAWDQAIEIGRDELEASIHENLNHFFDREMPEPEVPMRDISVMDAIMLMRLYERRERERGKR